MNASIATRRTLTTRSQASGGSSASLGQRARQRSSMEPSAPAPASISTALASFKFASSSPPPPQIFRASRESSSASSSSAAGCSGCSRALRTDVAAGCEPIHRRLKHRRSAAIRVRATSSTPSRNSAAAISTPSSSATQPLCPVALADRLKKSDNFRGCAAPSES